jgi:hypothetical protein
VGDVYRPENIPGLVFEEVTVKAVDQTVDGPTGPADGAVITDEELMDGTIEHKTYAPGYGEFQAHDPVDDELVTVAVAVPADVVGERVPDELRQLRQDVPELLASQMSDALDALHAAVDAEGADEARQAAIDVAHTALDLQLQHREPSEVDESRIQVWLRQVKLDRDADDAANVACDLVTIELIEQRTRDA